MHHIVPQLSMTISLVVLQSHLIYWRSQLDEEMYVICCAHIYCSNIHIKCGRANVDCPCFYTRRQGDRKTEVAHHGLIKQWQIRFPACYSWWSLRSYHYLWRVALRAWRPHFRPYLKWWVSPVRVLFYSMQCRCFVGTDGNVYVVFPSTNHRTASKRA